MKTAEKSTYVDYSFLRQKSPEELREILRQDLEHDEKETSYELILAVMEELEHREKESGISRFSDTEDALERLHEQIFASSAEEETSKTPEHKSAERSVRGKNKHSLWPRFLGAAAVVAVVILLGTVTANASGYNLWANISRWSKETFSFREERGLINEPMAFGQLDATLLEYDITEQVLPKWLPEQYQFDDVYVSETPVFLQITVQGWAEERSLLVHIIKQKDPEAAVPAYYEIAEGSLNSYITHGVEHFIAKNTDHVCIMWETNAVQVSLDFSDEGIITNAKRIIDSIYEE